MLTRLQLVVGSAVVPLAGATTGATTPTVLAKAEVMPSSVTEKSMEWTKDSDQPTPQFMAMQFDVMNVKNPSGDIYVNMPGCPAGKEMVKKISISYEGTFQQSDKDSNGKINVVDKCYQNFYLDTATKPAAGYTESQWGGFMMDENGNQLKGCKGMMMIDELPSMCCTPPTLAAGQTCTPGEETYAVEHMTFMGDTSVAKCVTGNYKKGGMTIGDAATELDFTSGNPTKFKDLWGTFGKETSGIAQMLGVGMEIEDCGCVKPPTAQASQGSGSTTVTCKSGSSSGGQGQGNTQQSGTQTSSGMPSTGTRALEAAAPKIMAKHDLQKATGAAAGAAAAPAPRHVRRAKVANMWQQRKLARERMVRNRKERIEAQHAHKYYRENPIMWLADGLQLRRQLREARKFPNVFRARALTASASGGQAVDVGETIITREECKKQKKEAMRGGGGHGGPPGGMPGGPGQMGQSHRRRLAERHLTRKEKEALTAAAHRLVRRNLQRQGRKGKSFVYKKQSVRAGIVPASTGVHRRQLTSSSFGGTMQPGMDPNAMGGMDPNAMGGMDPNAMGGMDPNAMGGMDPNAMGGMDPNAMGGMDPNAMGGQGPNMGPNGMGGGMDPNAMGGMDPNAMGGPPGGGPPDMANMDFDEMDPDEMMALEFDSTNVQSAGFKPPPGMENEVDGASFNMNAEGEMVMTTASGEEVIMDAPMGPSEAAIAVAPFASDGVANFFKFFNPTTSGRYPFGENEDPTTKYTIFVDAESRSVNDTTTGFVPKCKYGSEFWVKLGPGDRTGGAGWTAGTRTPHLGGNDFVKLVRVDGVDWSCISSYTDAVPEEVLALDIVMALEATSGAVPPVTTGSKVQVEVINKSGSTEIHEIIIGGNQGVKNYNQLRMVIEKKQEMVWDGLMGDMMEDMFMSDLGIDPMAMGADPMMAADPGMASAAMYGAAGADPSAKSTPKKAKSCFRGSVMAQVVKPKCFPTCARTGVTRAANTEEATAIAALKGDEIPFVLLKKRYNLKTLKEDSSFAASLPAAFKEGTCTARVGGLVDANGGAIFREKVSVPFKPPSCDFLTMNGTRTDLENMLTQMQSKVMEVNVNALARYEGTDTWSNCQALLNMGLKDAVETITVKSVGCPHTPPSCAGETEFEICTREANKNHPWCKDPCCNIDMQKTKCCAERDVQKNVKSSEVNPMAFGFSCPFGGADSIDGIEIAKATQRVLNNPQTCFGKESASKKAKLKALKDAAECCYAAVFGNDPSEEMFAAGGGSGDSKKKNSIQTCSSDLDCYSGTCIKVKSSSSGGGGGGAAAGGGSSGGGSGGSSGTDATPPKAFKHCFTTGSATNKGPFTTKGKSYTCALAPMATAGTALAQCLKDRFDKDAAGLATAWAIVSDLYGQGGDANADVSTIGAQLVSADTFQSCEGETGWMYNADDFFVREVLKTCSDESDCAAKCVSETKCNWAPMGTKLTNDECLNMFPSQTSFCKDPDGARWGQPSKTRPAVCQSSTVKILQSWDMWSYQQDKLQGVLRAMNVSDAECATIGDGTMRRTFTGMFDMDMTSFDMDDPMAMTAMPEMKPVYTCGHPNATTKIACLEECIGDSGFKPSASYRCEMPTNADGGCPTNWRVEQPPMEFDAMGMPIFSQPVCVPDDYGLTFSGANSPYTGFTDGVHTSGLYYPWDFTWFTDAQQGSTDRCAVLAAITGLETTVKRLMDDGSGFCFDDMCYFNATAAGIADYGACMNKVPSDQQSSYSTMFQQDWMNGNGACVIMRNDGWGDMMTSMTDFSTSPRKPADLNAFKTTCEGWGGSFYEGKRFEEPAVDTQELCSGHTECEIDMGYKVPGLTAEECAKNKRCLDSSGWPASCPGCEMDWSQYDAKDGACVKKVKQKSDCSTTTFYPSKSTALTGAGICYDATKMRGDCGSGWEYLECRESIPVASCKAATVASGTWAEPMTLLSQQLKCIPTVWGKCKDKADCEVGGMCTINTAALSNDAMMDPMMMMGMDPMAGMMGVPQEVWGPTEASKLTKKSTGSGGSGDQNQQQGMEDDPFMMMECIPHSKYMTPYFFDNVCKTDMSDVDVQDPMNPCGIDTSFTRVETDKCSGMVYDPFVFFDGNACYHYLTAQADCTGAGKSWVATGATQATCEGKKICMGGDGFDTGGRGKKECEKCNGLFDVANKWMANKFETSKLTNVTGEWTARAVEPVNKLITTMEKEPFMRKLGEVKRQLEAEEETQAMMCYFGRTATQLATIASICEQNRAPEYVPASTDSKNVYTTAAENKVGGEAEAQVAISAKTFNATTGGKRKQVGMETTTIKAEVPEISSAAASSSRRSLEELKEELRLLSAAGATTNDPGCYSVVKNANNKLVGQLTGDCFGMKTADGGTSMDGAAELCLNEKEEIKKSPSYTVPAFALRSGSAGAYTYSATAKTVKKNGPKLCASVTEANTYFCPAATVANAATQTADQGTAACPALKTQLDQVSQAATLVGGTAIPGTSAPATTSTAANTTSAAALPAGSVVASTAEFGINLPSSVQESQLMGLLGDSMKTGIAIAAGTAVEASQVTISELKFKVRRNLLEAAPMPQALAHPEDRDERRRLSTSAPKTLAVDYSIFIPATTAGASALVANLAAKMSTGTTASASFATALMSGFTSGLNAAGLSSQFTVTSVAVTGTATTTQTVASSSAYTTMLPSLALAFTSLLATFIFL